MAWKDPLAPRMHTFPGGVGSALRRGTPRLSRTYCVTSPLPTKRVMLPDWWLI